MKKIALFAMLVFWAACDKPNIRNACEQIAVDDTVDSFKIMIPNAFTPDGDGNNDLFRPLIFHQNIQHQNINNLAPNITFFEVKRYNSGFVVYNGEWNNNQGWNGDDGGQVKEELYEYHLEIETSQGTKRTYTGRLNALEGYSGKCYNNTQNCVFEDAIIASGSAGAGYVPSLTSQVFSPCQ